MTTRTPAVAGYDPDICRRALHDQRRHRRQAHNPTASCRSPRRCRPARRPASRTRTTRGSRRLRECLQLPGRRGAGAGRVPEEHALRDRDGEVRAGPDAPVSVVGRTAPDFQVDSSRCPTATRRPSPSTARRASGDLRPALPDLGRTGAHEPVPGSGRAASCTATKTTSTSASSGAPSRAPTPATRSRSGSPVTATELWSNGRRERTLHLHGRRRTPATTCWCWPTRTTGAQPNPTPSAPPAVRGQHHAALGPCRAVRQRRPGTPTRRERRAAPARRAVPLRRGRLVHRRQPVHRGPGGRRHRRRPSGATSPVVSGRRAPAVPDPCRPRLHERGRQARSVDGELAQYYGDFGFVGGTYYGLNGHPRPDCVDLRPDDFDDCLILADDFSQYWLGAGTRDHAGAGHRRQGHRRTAGRRPSPHGDSTGARPTPSTRRAPSRSPATRCRSPQFPQFRSWKAGRLRRCRRRKPFGPYLGQQYAAAPHVDEGYQRLGPHGGPRRAATSAPPLDFAISSNTEGGYDHVIVEAHTVGQDDWTTVPISGGVHEQHGRPDRVRGGLPAGDAPVPDALPDRRHDLRGGRHDRDVEQA